MVTVGPRRCLEREDPIGEFASECERGGLFRILTKESTQVLDDFIRWLGNIMMGAKLDKRSHGNCRTSLEIQILLILREDQLLSYYVNMR